MTKPEETEAERLRRVREKAARLHAANLSQHGGRPGGDAQLRREGARYWATLGLVAVVGVLAIVFIAYMAAQPDTSPTPAAADSVEAPVTHADGECAPGDTTAAIDVRAALTSDLDLAGSNEAAGVTVDGMTYVAVPVGSGDSALVAGFPEGTDPDDTLVAVNGTARSHTSLPPGGDQAGIDAALGCLGTP